MVWYYILLYAIIQGITEFLPVSSSGHLVLAHEWVDGRDADVNLDSKWAEDAVIDIAVHVGTLFSVLLYFRSEFFSIAKGSVLTVVNYKNVSKEHYKGFKMAAYIGLGSLPVIIAGYALHQWQPDWIRSPEVVAWTTLIFAYLLWMADRFCPAKITIESMNIKSALWIGCAQIFALIPGTSRSGVTMTAARALGYTRDAAAHFSLFLSVVAISGAGLLAGLDVFERAEVRLGQDAIIAALVSFIAGYIAISVMLKWLQRHDFTIFVLYRALLGTILLLLIYLN